jgi:DNA-binding NarL/FixJ family response regulator
LALDGIVLIQDRSRLFRESLATLIGAQSPFRVDVAVDDAEVLRAAISRQRLNAVVFEATTVPWDVSAMVGEIKGLTPDIALIGTYPHEYRSHLSSPGVRYVKRTSPVAQFLRAVRGSPPASDGGMGSGSQPPTSVSELITRREFQVLALISGGLTTAQIAARLGISAKTVENRKQALFTKLGVQNQSHAVAVAMRTGLLSTGGSGQDLADP